ncbi:hypothetical protein DAI22_09g024201 [Oryza sativa Japonica Group]|nr:hypothetical protein DAI22_09g024201 [Oryza sativa Japonica Group]
MPRGKGRKKVPTTKPRWRGRMAVAGRRSTSAATSRRDGVPDLIRNVVGIVGNVISFGLFLSPVPTFWRIIKNKDVRDFKADHILVVTINGIGLVIEAVYLTIFFLFSDKKNKKKMGVVLATEALFMAAVALGVLLDAHTHQRRSSAP